MKTTEGATNAGVRQDKYPPGRIDVFSDQPQSADIPTESAKTAPPPANPPADTRPKHHGSETRQTAMIWGRAPFATKAKILAMADAQGLTESKVVVDRKSTRLNSSHLVISYAVFCLKIKKSIVIEHV